jgi:hypothetical protein
MNNGTQIAGEYEASRYALALLRTCTSAEEFHKWTMPEQLEFVVKAGLDGPGLIAAMRYLGAWHEATAKALENYVAGRRPPLRLVP